MSLMSDSEAGLPKSSVMETLRLHDQLLEAMPEGATHDRETCDLCSATDNGKGGTHVKTYTEEELQVALDESNAELTTRLQELESAARASEVESKVEAAKAEVEAEIAELRTKLDTAVLEAQAAKAELESVKTYLAEAADLAVLDAEIAARRDERLAKVKEVASFPEDYLEANADRFAAMSDEDFEGKIAEWAMLSPKVPTGEIPAKTALTGSREVASSNDKGNSLVKSVFRDILGGLDPRTL